MNSYNIRIDEDALQDIQNATIWYNKQLEGLGFKFQKQIKSQINALKKDATIYVVRYYNVRCMNIKKFPFMVHYSINTDLLLVEVFAVTHTSRNPTIWNERIKK